MQSNRLFFFGSSPPGEEDDFEETLPRLDNDISVEPAPTWFFFLLAISILFFTVLTNFFHGFY